MTKNKDKQLKKEDLPEPETNTAKEVNMDSNDKATEDLAPTHIEKDAVNLPEEVTTRDERGRRAKIEPDYSAMHKGILCQAPHRP